MRDCVPVEFIFNPNWWFSNYSISFDESFYLDRDARVENDFVMRQALWDRFGFGEKPISRRPVIGSEYVAGGFIIPALLGVEIQFEERAAPAPICRYLTADEVRRLKAPDVRRTWPVNRLLADIEVLERDYGYVVGDWNTDGILNTAIHLRGYDLFTDFYDDPGLVRHLFRVIAKTMVQVAELLRKVSGTCSVSVNRSIVHRDPAIFLHANCSLQMISPETYTKHVLPWEMFLARNLQPYGIHHCGSNLHLFAEFYSRLSPEFVDVGWGSDPGLCRKAFPHAFLNLRLSPVRMLQLSAEEVAADARRLIAQAGDVTDIGLCCINMDYGTPDENILQISKIGREIVKFSKNDGTAPPGMTEAERSNGLLVLSLETDERDVPPPADESFKSAGSLFPLRKKQEKV
ncbi:MAG TPA: uroporphyrinogen decarboxylase family protein [Acidobacteriota bacterium]|nr:uroporphyrinogen decarboxylase family protein [Acidobacteriota bacterium]